MKRDFLVAAEQAARMAGAYILSRLGSLAGSEIESKDAADFVTEVDRTSEKLIVETIQSHFPDHDVLAEESRPDGGGTGRARGYRWIIDPLDGTTNFIHQFPVFSVSIALECDAELIVGVVFDPLREELFAAARGAGATLNGKPISVSRRTAGGALVATGFPFRSKGHIEAYLATFRDVFLSVGDLRRAGSAAIDLACVAAGRVEGFFELGLAPWDIAAGALLIREAGGVVTDFGGGDGFLETGNIVAGSPGIHETLLAITRTRFRGILDR